MKAVVSSAVVALVGCSVVPNREVLPYPDHIHAGVAVGDKVQVVTRDGQVIDMVVTELTTDGIVAADATVGFEDIATLTKRSWSLPRNPCDDGKPLGCSLPPLVTVLSEMHADYSKELQAPCTQHDFCYRNGSQTYGLSRDECDAKFLDDMQRHCAAKSKIDFVGRLECDAVAGQMHSAVRQFGAKYFQSSGGAYCEYAGPPAHQLLRK